MAFFKYPTSQQHDLSGKIDDDKANVSIFDKRDNSEKMSGSNHEEQTENATSFRARNTTLINDNCEMVLVFIRGAKATSSDICSINSTIKECEEQEKVKAENSTKTF
jgi:hypothetical protein